MASLRMQKAGFLATAMLFSTVVLPSCDDGAPRAPALQAQEALSAQVFAGLVERMSEPSGYFDTDNLISNETGYLNVLDALTNRGLQGGAYVGVGPDQNFSYIAQIRPEIAFIVDVRRDNLLHHLLLKALMEGAPTRVEFLSRLHGMPPPPDPEEWTERSVLDVLGWVDSVHAATEIHADGPGGMRVVALQDTLLARIDATGIPLEAEDHATIRRFHNAFVSAGPALRFTSFGRPPRPYYPTYRQLLTETDVDGDRTSYLASRARYEVVRELQLANRIIPLVGDLAGPHALRELGEVMEEMGVRLEAFYASNVEFYLWRDRTLWRWLDNLQALPADDDAVVIRSYFSNFGRGHPSAVRGYYATQIVQPVSTLVAGDFESYWDLVTRDVLPLR